MKAAPLLAFGLICALAAVNCKAESGQDPARYKAPLVSCESDGQEGLKFLPANAHVRIPTIPAGSNLAFYTAWGTPGVLGPTGWHCAGFEGSSGGTLVLTPEEHRPSEFLFGKTAIKGPVIEISLSFGGTSGRFSVARLASRLFPKAKPFIDEMASDDLIDKSTLPSGPYPTDHLSYHNDFVVEYMTPPHKNGIGTDSFLAQDNDPIRGVVLLAEKGDHDLIFLAARLPPAEADALQTIISDIRRRGFR